MDNGKNEALTVITHKKTLTGIILSVVILVIAQIIALGLGALLTEIKNLTYALFGAYVFMEIKKKRNNDNV